jgi:hypothetical protein
MGKRGRGGGRDIPNAGDDGAVAMRAAFLDPDLDVPGLSSRGSLPSLALR